MRLKWFKSSLRNGVCQDALWCDIVDTYYTLKFPGDRVQITGPDGIVSNYIWLK